MQSAANGSYSPFQVEMFMAQHLSLWGFLAFTAIGTNVRTSLIPPPAPKKISRHTPRLTTREGKPDGGVWVSRRLEATSPPPRSPASAHH